MQRRTTVSFHTLGCKLNQAETETLSRQFIEAGCEVVQGTGDICLLNTCTVTHIADRKSRHLIRVMRKSNPNAFVIVTGCCVETAPADMINAGADMVVTNENKARLVQLVLERKPVHRGLASAAPVVQQRVRSFVKIQQGCTNNCSYCIVPSVRGTECSLSADGIIKEIRNRKADGYKEIVLTGTRIGAYQDNGVHLAELIRKILAETAIQRLHLSSLQPQEMSSQLLSLWHNERLCPHFHLALQSGSNAVLRRMRRRYTTDEFRSAVAQIRDVIPHASVTTDIIVGFPGENDNEFDDSFRFCRDIGFAAIHVFMFSARPGTPAAAMPNQIDAPVKKMRSLRMLALAQKSAVEYRKQFIGQIHNVLWESETNPGTGIYDGLTDTYIRVFARSDQPLNNRLLPVKLTAIVRGGIKGEMTA